MPTRHRRRSRLAFLVLPLVLILIAGYFGWQSTRGSFSREARETLAVERQERAEVLEALVAERRALEAKVMRLRSDALDADLLDERVREKLNMAFPNELVIVLGRAGPPPAPAPALAAHGN